MIQASMNKAQRAMMRPWAFTTLSTFSTLTQLIQHLRDFEIRNLFLREYTRYTFQPTAFTAWPRRFHFCPSSWTSPNRRICKGWFPGARGRSSLRRELCEFSSAFFRRKAFPFVLVSVACPSPTASLNFVPEPPVQSATISQYDVSWWNVRDFHGIFMLKKN